MKYFRNAQVIDDKGTLAPMRFSDEQRARIEAVQARLGRSLKWTAIETTVDGSADICPGCGCEFTARRDYALCADCEDVVPEKIRAQERVR